MPTLAHIEAAFRGWHPSWLSQLRTWSTDEALLWLIVAFAFLRTARTLSAK